MTTPEPAEIEIGDEPTARYRLFDADDVVIYVGITKSPASRMDSHSREDSWWPEVARKTMCWYPTRVAARIAETAAIEAHEPKYNKMKSSYSPAAAAAAARSVRAHRPGDPVFSLSPNGSPQWFFPRVDADGKLRPRNSN